MTVVDDLLNDVVFNAEQVRDLAKRQDEEFLDLQGKITGIEAEINDGAHKLNITNYSEIEVFALNQAYIAIMDILAE